MAEKFNILHIHGHDAGLTDMGLGVMLMMRLPGHPAFAAGRVEDAMVSQMDIFPTLCDLLEVPAPDWLQGVSMLPLLMGEADVIRDHVFGGQGYHCLRRDPQRSIRTQRYRYTRRMEGPYLRIVDPGPTNDWMNQLGYPEWPQGRELLYDLYFDPCEMHNRADDPSMAEIKADLAQQLDQWMADTDDPFRHGDVPGPVVSETAT